MKFGLLYEIEVARPWTETSVADCFWEALEQVKVAGAFINNQFAAFTILFCGKDDADAVARAGEGAAWYANLVELVYASLATLSEDQSYAWYRERVATEANRERDIQELIDRRSVIVGGPARCFESIKWFEQQGVDMMFFLVQAGTIKHADIIDSLRRFGREVMPHFGAAARSAAATLP